MPLRDDMKLISVDDHVIEPAGVWADRLPTKFRDAGPRLVELDEPMVVANPWPDGATRLEGFEATLPAGSQTWIYEGEPAPDMTLSAVYLPTGAARLVQRAHGFRATVVGGEVVLRDGAATEARPGRLLRGRRDAASA